MKLPTLLQSPYSLPIHHPFICQFYKHHSLPLLTAAPPLAEEDEESYTDAQRDRRDHHRDRDHHHSDEDTTEDSLSVDEEPSKIKKRHRPPVGSNSTSSRRLHSKTTRRGQSATHPKILQHRDSDTEDTESRGSRHPLGSIYIQKQKQQRVENHPNNNMAHPKKDARRPKHNKPRSGRAASSSRAAADESDDATTTGTTASATTLSDVSNAEYILAQKRLTAMQHDLVVYNSQKSASGKKAAKDRTIQESEVYTCAKNILFKKCKCLNDKSFKEKVVWVMDWIKPREFEGMPPDLLKSCQDTWILRYQDFVSNHAFP